MHAIEWEVAASRTVFQLWRVPREERFRGLVTVYTSDMTFHLSVSTVACTDLIVPHRLHPIRNREFERCARGRTSVLQFCVHQGHHASLCRMVLFFVANVDRNNLAPGIIQSLD